MARRDNNSKLLSLEEMEQIVDEAIGKICSVVSNDTTIVIFVGNGISPPELYISKIPENFIKDLRRNNPREFGRLVDDARIFVEEYLDPTKISGIEMDFFLEKLGKFDYIKRRFYSYLKLLCCKAKPTESHFSLYSLCCLLNALGSGEKLDNVQRKDTIVRVFTTNYDNLIEKAYYFRKNIDYPQSWKNRVGKESVFDADKFYDELDCILLIPEYIFDLTDYEDIEGLKAGFYPYSQYIIL